MTTVKSFYYTPDTTGKYRIYSTTNSTWSDPYVKLYRWNGNSYELMDAQDNAHSWTSNFDITNQLEKGTTYQIDCSGSGSYYVYLKQAN